MAEIVKFPRSRRRFAEDGPFLQLCRQRLRKRELERHEDAIGRGLDEIWTALTEPEMTVAEARRLERVLGAAHAMFRRMLGGGAA
jgi:hypothetical protein